MEYRDLDGLVSLTSVPWASQPSLWRQDTILQRRTIMGTVGIQRMHLVIQLDEQHLPSIDTLDFGFDFVAVLQA